MVIVAIPLAAVIVTGAMLLALLALVLMLILIVPVIVMFVAPVIVLPAMLFAQIWLLHVIVQAAAQASIASPVLIPMVSVGRQPAVVILVGMIQLHITIPSLLAATRPAIIAAAAPALTLPPGKGMAVRRPQPPAPEPILAVQPAPA